MPKKLERKLKKRAAEMGLSKERTGAYVYGTLNKIEKASAEADSEPHKKKLKSLFRY